MAAKAFFVFCTFALLVQIISGQAIGACNRIAGTALAAEELALAGNALAYGSNLAGRGLELGPIGYPGCKSYGLAPNSFIPPSGGGFVVTSVSPIAPTGLTVVSENAIEGALAVNGELPFLSAVVVDGALPSAGTGSTNYGCGDGFVGIVSEGVGAAISPYNAIAPGAGGPALGLGAPGLGFTGPSAPGCGCKGIF